MKSISRAILKLFGWSIPQGIPAMLRKYVVAVAPHTSWKDFFLGLVVRSALGRKIYYLGKKELFDSPFGFFFRWTGGKPVDRKHKTGLVDQVAKFFESNDAFAIAVAPEGTRRKVQNFKTGFYYIAKKAGVPIIPCLFDYEHQEVRFLPPFYPTENAREDQVWKEYDFNIYEYSRMTGLGWVVTQSQRSQNCREYHGEEGESFINSRVIRPVISSRIQSSETIIRSNRIAHVLTSLTIWCSVASS